MELVRLPIPRPTPGEVFIRVDRAAICGSDLHAIFDDIGQLTGKGAPEPGLPGHECVGTVESTATAGEFSAGDRVLVVSAGSYAEFMLAPANQCVKLPDEPLDMMLMAQQLGVTHYAMRLFWPEAAPPGRTATVIGTGSVGLNFLQLLKLRGFETVIAADTLPARLRLAEAMGADTAVNAAEDSVVEATMELTAGVGADLVIEAAGYDVTRAQAIKCARTLGRVGLFGYPESTDGMSPLPYAEAFWKAPVSIEIVKGAQQVDCLPDFRAAIDLIASGKVAVDHLLGTEFPLAEINEALRVARAREAIKVQLIPGRHG
jgi:L-iditol 2-dehydrogenase